MPQILSMQIKSNENNGNNKNVPKKPRKGFKKTSKKGSKTLENSLIKASLQQSLNKSSDDQF